jgi:hypothetical protein
MERDAEQAALAAAGETDGDTPRRSARACTSWRR